MKWAWLTLSGGYLGVLVDVGVHVHALGVEGDHVSLPHGRRALFIQTQTEVLLRHPDVGGGRGQTQTLADGALWGIEMQIKHEKHTQPFNSVY